MVGVAAEELLENTPAIEALLEECDGQPFQELRGVMLTSTYGSSATLTFGGHAHAEVAARRLLGQPSGHALALAQVRYAQGDTLK